MPSDALPATFLRRPWSLGSLLLVLAALATVSAGAGYAVKRTLDRDTIHTRVPESIRWNGVDVPIAADERPGLWPEPFHYHALKYIGTEQAPSSRAVPDASRVYFLVDPFDRALAFRPMPGRFTHHRSRDIMSRNTGQTLRLHCFNTRWAKDDLSILFLHVETLPDTMAAHGPAMQVSRFHATAARALDALGFEVTRDAIEATCTAPVPDTCPPPADAPPIADGTPSACDGTS